MSDCPELDIAIALADELPNVQKLPVRRVYNALQSLEALKPGDVQLWVAPASDDIELGARRIFDHDIAVQVVLVCKLKSSQDVAEMDDLVRKLSKLKQLWLAEDGPLRETDLAGAEFKLLTNSPLWEQEVLFKYKVFFARLTLTYWIES